jgi:hypothetical protein
MTNLYMRPLINFNPHAPKNLSKIPADFHAKSSKLKAFITTRHINPYAVKVLKIMSVWGFLPVFRPV